MSIEDIEAFDSEMKDLFKAYSDSDLLIDYVMLGSALDPRTGHQYSVMLVPDDQVPHKTSGLIRIGTVVSDQVLLESLGDFETEEEGEDDD